MPNLATLLAVTIGTLRAVVAEGAARDRLRQAALVLVWNWLGRTLRRVERLHARFLAGTLPPRPAHTPPAPPAPPSETPEPRRHPRLVLPRARLWLVRILGHKAAAHATQLAALLARPDCAEFLAAAPQAGRLLRPLCRLLGTPLPPHLALPPRAPRPRPHRPPPPPQPQGKYPRFNAARYRPGRIPLNRATRPA